MYILYLDTMQVGHAELQSKMLCGCCKWALCVTDESEETAKFICRNKYSDKYMEFVRVEYKCLYWDSSQEAGNV